VAALSLRAVVEATAKPTATNTAKQTRLLNVVRLNRFMKVAMCLKTFCRDAFNTRVYANSGSAAFVDESESD
jgi:hypothetical protein